MLKADKIIVLEKGRIAGEGDHAMLMQTSTVYREICDSQLGSETLSESPGGNRKKQEKQP
ncbi:MAG: ABC transporter ATP-binding protein [Chlorobiaceae bacterium]|nr:ABC transporter ATP-binding protein [Chlorobiaceae bacterium]